ncbi:hypothetical protein QQP08_005592 [Theobroma cacao]|nr:hypothetical protein QQP08_005592 [Theobroma cacao]
MANHKNQDQTSNDKSPETRAQARTEASLKDVSLPCAAAGCGMLASICRIRSSQMYEITSKMFILFV